MHEQEKHFECVFFILEAKYNQLVGILDPANDDDDDDDDDHDDIDIDNDDHIVPYLLISIEGDYGLLWQLYIYTYPNSHLKSRS